MTTLTFPVWGLRYEESGQLMIAFGPPTPYPKTLILFTTQSGAEAYAGANYFVGKIVPLERGTLYEMLKRRTDYEEVVIDVGTPNAVKFRADQFNAMLETGKPELTKAPAMKATEISPSKVL